VTPAAVSRSAFPATLGDAGAGERARAFWRGARRERGAVAAVLTLLALALLAAAPGLFGLGDPYAQAPRDAFAPPSARFPFGTDELGRDILARTAWAGRVSLGTAVVVVMLSAAVGVPLGLAAGYAGGAVDAVLMRLIDAVLAFPAVLLAMGLIAVIGQGQLNAAIAVTVVSVPGFARLTRASVLAEKERDYVLAARAMGAGDGRLAFRTILPNCVGPLLVQAAFVATWAVLLEASLSFLGLGVKPPEPSWGQMLSAGKDFLYRVPWYGVFPGLALTVVVLSLNALGDAAQRLVDRR
jgi:ABC-type dipeptide/oligopeptide/nickel transport system permease subunit